MLYYTILRYTIQLKIIKKKIHTHCQKYKQNYRPQKILARPCTFVIRVGIYIYFQICACPFLSTIEKVKAGDIYIYINIYLERERERECGIPHMGLDIGGQDPHTTWHPINEQDPQALSAPYPCEVVPLWPYFFSPPIMAKNYRWVPRK